MLSFHLPLGIENVRFPRGLPVKILYTFHISHTLTIYIVSGTLLDFTVLMILGDLHK